MRAECFTHDVDIALNHRDRVVDFMRHTSRDFPNRGELFRHHQLLEGLFELGICIAELGCALINALIKLICPGA